MFCFSFIFSCQKQERNIENTAPQCAMRGRPQMTSLCCEGKEREILQTLVTWVTLACVLSDAVSNRNVTWPSSRRRPASLSAVSVKSRARPPLPLTTYSVPGCALSNGICETATKVTNFKLDNCYCCYGATTPTNATLENTLQINPSNNVQVVVGSLIADIRNLLGIYSVCIRGFNSLFSADVSSCGLVWRIRTATLRNYKKMCGKVKS